MKKKLNKIIMDCEPYYLYSKGKKRIMIEREELIKKIKEEKINA